MQDFREILNELGRTDSGHLPKIECRSGLSMSVQASKYHYSTPRMNIQDTTVYTAFEIGFPSEPVEALREYAEDGDDLTGTVYPYVPYEVIQQIIEDNGGIANPRGGL